MNFKEYYHENITFITYIDSRLNKIIDQVEKYRAKKILDVGCGNGYLLLQLRERNRNLSLTGVDIYKKGIKDIEIRKGDITTGLDFKSSSFDCVILGEVIEHVPNPDFLLREIRRVLTKNGILIISTPNLVSWANRIMVLLGIQPFFTETSSEVNLGRYLKILGQNEKVQGHLKIFTHKSLEEILIREKFEVIEKIGVPFFFPFPILLFDKLMTRIIPLSSGLLYVARKN